MSKGVKGCAKNYVINGSILNIICFLSLRLHEVFESILYIIYFILFKTTEKRKHNVSK